jgi:hypothetical protein
MTTTARKRFFTVAEANQTLPLVRAIVGDIVALYRDVDERRRRLAEIREARGSRTGRETTAYSEEVERIEEDLEKDIERLRGFVEELEELGVELKDPESGLIDFRSHRHGREVYLCWRHGEDDVAHWHDLDAGFAGRQPLDETGSASG